MGTIICHHEGRYNIYSTFSDEFYFESSISLDELKAYLKEENEKRFLRELDERLERAHEKGTSAFPDNSLEDTLCCNSAGKNGRSLSFKTCIKRFLS